MKDELPIFTRYMKQLRENLSGNWDRIALSAIDTIGDLEGTIRELEQQNAGKDKEIEHLNARIERLLREETL